jgi:L-iditol 2-dehydrogenase
MADVQPSDHAWREYSSGVLWVDVASAQPTSVRAAVWRGGSELKLEEWELPPLGGQDVLVKVTACGLCGSDLHVLDGGFPGLAPPVVLGHEPAGTVVDVGSSVDRFAPGDAVTWEPNVACGRCMQCRNGQEANLCESRVRVSGSFATHTVVPLQALHRLPPGCDPKAAILAEPLACALYAFERGQVRLDQSIAIIGAGTIGLLLVMLARAAGARAITVSDPNEAKREMARRLGADAAVDPLVDGFDDARARLTQGRGFDVAFEAVGLPQTVEDTLRVVRPGGHAVLVGASRPTDVAKLDLTSIQRRDLTISACWLRRHTFQRAVSLLQTLPVAELVTHEVGLSDVDEAIRLLRGGSAIKVAVLP